MKNQHILFNLLLLCVFVNAGIYNHTMKYNNQFLSSEVRISFPNDQAQNLTLVFTIVSTILLLLAIIINPVLFLFSILVLLDIISLSTFMILTIVITGFF